MTFTVTYNSYAITTSAVYINKFQQSESFERGVFSCEFVLESSDGTVDTFRTEEATMKAALTTRYKNLVIQQYTDGGTPASRISWSHTGKTALLVTPTLEKIADEMSTGITSKYRLKIEAEFPADEAGKSGRRSGQMDISYAANERVVATFTGVYTALSTPKTAYENAKTDGNAATWALAQLTALGFDNTQFELLSQKYTPDQENHLCDFSLVYQLVLDNETEADLNSASVVNAVVEYKMDSPQRIAIGPYPGQEEYVGGLGGNAPPVSLIAVYTAQIPDAQVAGDTTAETLYRETLKPWLLSHMQNALNLGSHPEAASEPYINNEQYNWTPSTNSFRGSLVMTVTGSPVQIIRYSEAIRQMHDLGIRRSKLWDGQASTFSSWSVGRTIRAHQSITLTKLNDVPNEPALLAAPWELDTHSRSDSAEYVGSPGDQHDGGNTIAAYEYTSQFTRAYTDVVPSQAGGGSEVTPGGEGGVVYEKPQAGDQSFGGGTISSDGTTIIAAPVGGG
jgi:hypothetical protein